MSSRRSSWRRKLPTKPLRLEGEPGTYFDPAYLSDETRHHRHQRKDQQLCEQVAEALSFALAECYDPHLATLYVEGVEPAPSTSRLRVVVSADAGGDAVAILEALARARSYLRSQIAGAIHRKRTPELSFELIAPEGE